MKESSDWGNLLNIGFVATKPINDTTVKHFSDLRNAPLSRDIYFSSGQFPVIESNDYRLGSVFAGYVCPTARINPDKMMSVSEYVGMLIADVEQTLLSIYSTYDNVALGFSGGIDSLVTLSLIERLGLLGRTTLVTMYNYAIPQSSDILTTNVEKQYALTEMLRILEPKCKEIMSVNLHENYLLQTINEMSFIHAKNYSSSLILGAVQNSAVLMGIAGQLALLHKSIQMDQVILSSRDPEETKKQIQKCQQNANSYTRSLLSYDINQHLRPYQYCHPWIRLSRGELRHGQSVLKDPLATAASLSKCLDFSTVTPSMLFDAEIGREIMHYAVGTLYDQFITFEGMNELDQYYQAKFKRTKLNHAVFDIPMTLNHNPEGLHWLREESAKDEVDLNVIYGLKMLQLLDYILTHNTLPS